MHKNHHTAAVVCDDPQQEICRKIRLGISALMLWIGITFIASNPQAAEVQNFGDRVPSPGEFIEALTPGEATAPKMRGIKPINPAASKTPNAVSMELTFEFNSANLSGSAKRTLNNLGGALQDQELKAYRFRIEGYTDSKGSAVYNQRLSEQRAQSVKAYLVGRLGIESRRLEAVGKGETDPLDPNDPENPANRRVQIVNLGG